MTSADEGSFRKLKGFFIYLLRHPETKEIRYLGCSNCPYRRYYQHISEANRGNKNPVYNWIRKLLLDGLRPEMVIIEECESELDMQSSEVNLIDIFRDYLKEKLLNVQTGGYFGGMTGFRGPRSEETKKKISLAHKGHHRGLGIPKSEETKMKISQALKGRPAQGRPKGIPMTEEWKHKMSLVKLGKKKSDETKAKMSKAQTGKIMNENTKAKLLESNLGRTPPNKGIPNSPEIRLKISKALKGKPWSKARRLAQEKRKFLNVK